MFGLGAQELLLILALALIFFGAERIPQIAKSLGRGLSELRRAQQEVKDELFRASEPLASPPDAASTAPPQVTCPSCAGQTAADSLFCSCCGGRMVSDTSCSVCLRALDPDDKFCPNCGQRRHREEG